MLDGLAISSAVGLSLLVSITVIPTAAARLLRTGQSEDTRSRAATSRLRRPLFAMLRRYTFLLLRSWPRIVDIIYWPTVQLLMWGFLQSYLAGQSGNLATIAGVFIGSVFPETIR